MSDTCEMWSLPWHALQRNLAMSLDGKAVVYSAVTVKAVNVQSATVGTNSWLGRARLRATPLTQQVRQ
jgi:hypothetical protein